MGCCRAEGGGCEDVSKQRILMFSSFRLLWLCIDMTVRMVSWNPWGRGLSCKMAYMWLLSKSSCRQKIHPLKPMQHMTKHERWCPPKQWGTDAWAVLRPINWKESVVCAQAQPENWSEWKTLAATSESKIPWHDAASAAWPLLGSTPPTTSLPYYGPVDNAFPDERNHQHFAWPQALNLLLLSNGALPRISFHTALWPFKKWFCSIDSSSKRICRKRCDGDGFERCLNVKANSSHVIIYAANWKGFICRVKCGKVFFHLDKVNTRHATWPHISFRIPPAVGDACWQWRGWRRFSG